MNMQAIMKQAQAMQKEITKIKNEIDSTVFEGKGSMVTVEVMGDKSIKSVKIAADAKEIINDDLSYLEDMIMVALNDAFSKIDKTTEEKMGKYSSMMPGLM